ncbi:MAG: hypothetical protein IJX14_05990, partial [Clostridia bacterium]|nr:hypothetical protein [Clostridia bacterium]
MKKNLRIGAAVLASALLLSGCGASMDGAEMETLKFETAAANGMAMDVYMDAEVAVEEAVMDRPSYSYSASTSAAEPGSSAEMAENDLSNRKLIRDANLDVETKTYDDFIGALEQQIASHGAYVQ